MCPQQVVTVSHGVHTYDQAVELAGHGRYNYLCLLVCSVIINAAAVDMFGFSIIVEAAKCDLQLGLTETGLLVSSPFAGLLFAYPWGYFADTKGRRRALLVSTTVGCIMAVLSGLAPMWEIMLALKVIGCSFSAASFTLCMTYLGECTSYKYRSQYLSVMNSLNLASEINEFVIAYLILLLSFNLPITETISFRPWRLLAIMYALPLGMGALMLLPLHESPKFLANKGKCDKALDVLKKIYKTNGGDPEKYPVKKISSNSKSDEKSASFCDSLRRQTVPIFKPPLLWRTLQLFYLLVISCVTNNVFAMWLPKMVNSFFISLSEGPDGNYSFCKRVLSNITIHEDETICDDTISNNTIYSGIAYGLIFLAFNLFIAMVSSWRKITLIGTFVMSAISSVVVNVTSQPVVNIIAFTCLQLTAVGIGIVASYFVDLYDTSYRGLVTSLGMMTARFGSLAGVNVVGAIVIDYCDWTFYFWSAFVLSGIVVALFLPSDKEMRNKNDIM